MKVSTALFVGALASMGIVTAGFAETWSPASTTGSVGPNVVQVRKGLTLNCTLHATTQTNSTGSTAQITALNLTPASGLLTEQCPDIEFSGFPYNIEPDGTSLTSIIIQGVVVTGLTGNCAGNLKAAFNQSTGVITFSHSNTVPATSGIGNCSLAGNASTSPAASYTIP
jgi:hypothetical protein